MQSPSFNRLNFNIYSCMERRLSALGFMCIRKIKAEIAF